MRINMTRWRWATAAGAAGVLAVSAAGSASAQYEDGSVGAADSVVEQFNTVVLEFLADAWANTGENVQINTVDQGNETSQDGLADANGGDAVATSGDYRDTVAVATGGEGGTADALNDALSENTSTGDNSITSGDATADNAAGLNITQDNDGEITNDAAVIGSGGAATSLLVQDNSAEVYVVASARANSGYNAQDNSVSQGNATSQVGTASANGGAAAAGGGGNGSASDALAGGGGTATASNTATSSNTSTGGNSISTGAASATNTSSVSVSQTNVGTSTNTVVVAPAAP